jgi:hypothetical protein
MSHTIHFEESRNLQTSRSKPLDETVWRAWLNKNRLEEGRHRDARIKGVKWICIGMLVAAALASSYVLNPSVSAYQTVVRFAIGLGAISLLFESLRERQYVFSALFTAIVLLFNPVFPISPVSANWLILFASVLPFAASLIWMKERSRGAAVPASVCRLAGCRGTRRLGRD